MHSRQRDVSGRLLLCWFFLNLLSSISCTADVAKSESSPVESVVKAEVSDEPTASATDQDIRLNVDGSDRSRSRDLYLSDYGSGTNQLYQNNRNGLQQNPLSDTRMLPAQSLSLGYPTSPLAYGNPYGGAYPQVSPYNYPLHPGLAQQYQYPGLYQNSPLVNPLLAGLGPFHQYLGGPLDYQYGRIPPNLGGYQPSLYSHPYVDPYHLSYPSPYNGYGNQLTGHSPYYYGQGQPHNLHYQPSHHGAYHNPQTYGTHHDPRHQTHNHHSRGYNSRDPYRGLDNSRGGYSSNHDTVAPYSNQGGGYYEEPGTRGQTLSTLSSVENPSLAVAPSTAAVTNVNSPVSPISPIPNLGRIPYGFRQRRLRPQNQLQSDSSASDPSSKPLDIKLEDASAKRVNQVNFSPQYPLHPQRHNPEDPSSIGYRNPGSFTGNRSLRRTLNRLYNTEQLQYEPPKKPANQTNP